MQSPKGMQSDPTQAKKRLEWGPQPLSLVGRKR
jgi:hypothetical protein